MPPDFRPPSSCVVLVPAYGPIDPGCDDALRELERRGYPVWRVRGYAAVDAARNQMASDALGQGFEELLWIDSDIVFDPDDVDKLRGHGLPFVCGLYPKKGPAQLACEFLPNTPLVRLGRHGSLVEVRYCGLGFTLTRKVVYAAVHQRLVLPVCNQRFGVPLVPFFEPTTVDEPPGRWSLSEDYAFCDRARRAGVKVMADTTVRLWHVGPYRYGWEDAAGPRDRHPDLTVLLPAGPYTGAAAAPGGGFTADWVSYNLPVWTEVLGPLAGKPAHALEVGVFEGRTSGGTAGTGPSVWPWRGWKTGSSRPAGRSPSR